MPSGDFLRLAPEQVTLVNGRLASVIPELTAWRGGPMLHLRTLGSLDLRGGDAARMRAVLAQPKRLGLLVYLALARPRGFHRRDSIIAVFWPEHDSDHARNALRQSLHSLRQSLGAEVLDARGDSDVGIDWSRFSCDADEFEASLLAGRPVEALELYRGDLLPGFSLPVREFDEWLDAERSRLRRRAAAAAWELSAHAASSGDLSMAVQWARHVAAFSPDDEAAVQRLMSLLARAGDRTGVARVYENFRKRLADDFDMEPSAELEAIAKGVTIDRPSPASSSWALAPAGRHPATEAEYAVRHQYEMTAGPQVHRLAVLPFAIHAAPRFGYLREGAAEMLSSALGGSGPLRMVDQHAIRSYCGLDGEADLRQGKALAHRLGAGEFVIGAVVGTGRKVRLRATLHENDGAVVGSFETNTSGEEEIFSLVDDLARRILAARYAGPGGRLARSAAETTDSVAGLKHFLDGERHFLAGRWVKAREAYMLALGDDPNLALAWQRMSWSSCWLLQPDEARSFAAKGLAASKRLPDRDALWLAAFGAYLDGDSDNSERNYRALLARWPDDVQAYVGLGLLLLMLNPMRGRSADEATDPLTYARILDPGNIDARLMLAYLSARSGRFEEMDALREWLSPDSDYKLMVTSSHSIARRRHDEMHSIRVMLEHAPEVLVHECARYAAVIGHDIAESHRIAAILTTATRSPEVRAVGHVLIAQCHLVQGCIRSSTQEFRAAQSFAPAVGLTYRALAAVLPFLRPNPSELLQLQEELATWDARPRAATGAEHLAFMVHQQVYPQLREYLLAVIAIRLGKKKAPRAHRSALVSLAGSAEAIALGADLALSIDAQAAYGAGDVSAALSLLEKTRLRPPYERVQMQSPFFSQNLERYTRARLLEEAGRLDEALHWYDSLCENGVHEFAYLAPSHLRRGIIHKRLGQTESAAAHFTSVTEIWAACDRELKPVVAHAIRELAQLAG